MQWFIKRGSNTESLIKVINMLRELDIKINRAMKIKLTKDMNNTAEVVGELSSNGAVITNVDERSNSVIIYAIISINSVVYCNEQIKRITNNTHKLN